MHPRSSQKRLVQSGRERSWVSEAKHEVCSHIRRRNYASERHHGFPVQTGIPSRNRPNHWTHVKANDTCRRQSPQEKYDDAGLYVWRSFDCVLPERHASTKEHP